MLPSSSRVRRTLGILLGPLRRRFLVLLALLAALSSIPWLLSSRLHAQLAGTAERVDLAGSLRYRVLELGLVVRARGVVEMRSIAEIDVAQRRALAALIEGGEGMRPCVDTAHCDRLRDHLEDWSGRLVPLAKEVLAHADLGSLDRLEQELYGALALVDEVVRAMAASAEARVAQARRLGRVAMLAGALCVLLVGAGIWDVFGRIRRLKDAARRAADDGDSLSQVQGSDEIASLARTLGSALERLRLRSEAELHTRIAALLATLPRMRDGAAELGAALDALVTHDVAFLELRGSSDEVEQTWQLGAGEARSITGSCGLPAAERATLLAGDEIEACPHLQQLHPTAVMLVPLRAAAGGVGSLALVRLRSPFVAQELDAAAAIGPILASAVDRMRLEARLRDAGQSATVDGLGRMLAHEVRNPLNSLALRTQLLERRLARLGLPAQDAAAFAADVGVLHGEITRLDALVGDYLTLGSEGRARREPVDLRALIEDACDVHRPTLEQLGITVELDLGTAPAMAIVDGAKITQILHNLVLNATEALRTSEVRRLRVHLRWRGAVVEIHVADSGPGVADPEQIFAPGYSTRPYGPGMGLSISRQIAHSHGGRLTVRQSDDGGATFILALAAETAHQVAGA